MIGVSDASVVRLCKSIGDKGFQEFKISAALETIPSGQQYHSKLQKDDSAEEICQKIFNTERTALQRTIQSLGLEIMKHVAHILAQAGHIVFAGTGASMIAARDAQYKFLKIGIHVCAAEEKDIQLMEASLLNKGDVFFAVSPALTPSNQILSCLWPNSNCTLTL